MARRQMKIAPMVERTIAALDLEPEDAALYAGAVQLARRYADAIDGLDDDQLPRLIGTIGPSLLKALEALRATPAARLSAVPKGGTTPDVSPVRAAILELRGDSREHRAAAVDSPAP